MDIRILGVETVDDYTAYVLQVSKGDKVWTVKHRYSTFDDLRKVATRELGNLAQPFPGKQLFGKLTPAQTSKRKDQSARAASARPTEFRASLPRARRLELWIRELAQTLELPPGTRDAFAAFVAEPAAGGRRSSDGTAGAARAAAPEAPARPPAPAPEWDPSFMSSDPLAGLGDAPAAPPPPPPSPPKAKPAPAPKPAAAPAAPCGAAPSFLVGRSAKTYETSGEGLRDAVKSGDLRGVQRVLAKDASLANYQDRQMESMLHLSAIFNHAAIAVELVKHGAKIDVKNQDDETPLDVALPSLKAKIQSEYDKVHA